MRRLRPRGLPYVALGCAILATQTLKADTILFSDLAEEFTVSVTDPVREQVHGSGSGAFVLISPPDGATLIAGGGVAYWRILEPGTVFRGPLDPVIQSDFVDLNPYGFCATPRGDPCFTF